MRTTWMRPFALAASFLIGSGFAFAQDDRKRPSDDDRRPDRADRKRGEKDRAGRYGLEEFIKDYDTDKDKALQRKELPPRLRDDFKRLDRDEDGKLGREELRRHGRRMFDRMRQGEIIYVWVWSAPRDPLTMRDLQQAYGLLRSLDKDNDGKLTKEEVEQGREATVQHWVESQFQNWDANDDGELGKKEVRGRLRREFARFDDNDNGALTKDEMRQAIMKEAATSAIKRGETDREEKKDDR